MKDCLFLHNLCSMSKVFSFDSNVIFNLINSVKNGISHKRFIQYYDELFTPIEEMLIAVYKESYRVLSSYIDTLLKDPNSYVVFYPGTNENNSTKGTKSKTEVARLIPLDIQLWRREAFRSNNIGIYKKLKYVYDYELKGYLFREVSSKNTTKIDNVLAAKEYYGFKFAVVHQWISAFNFVLYDKIHRMYKDTKRVFVIQTQDVDDKDLDKIFIPHILASKGLIPTEFEHFIITNDRDFQVFQHSEYKLTNFVCNRFRVYNNEIQTKISSAPSSDKTLESKLESMLSGNNDYIDVDNDNAEEKEHWKNHLLRLLTSEVAPEIELKFIDEDIPPKQKIKGEFMEDGQEYTCRNYKELMLWKFSLSAHQFAENGRIIHEFYKIDKYPKIDKYGTHHFKTDFKSVPRSYRNCFNLYVKFANVLEGTI